MSSNERNGKERIGSKLHSSSGFFSTADKLKLPYRVRIMEVVNIQGLIKQAHASEDSNTPGDVFSALGGVVQVLVEIVFGGEVLASSKLSQLCCMICKWCPGVRA